MAKATKRKLKAAVIAVCSVSLVALLLFVVKFRSHTPTMAFSALAAALQNNDQAQIKRLTTPSGLSSLHVMSARYGQKRLGDYLAIHKSARPTPHVFFHIVVFMLDESKAPPMTAFFKWTWDGWKLTSIDGTLTLRQPHNQAVQPTLLVATPLPERRSGRIVKGNGST